MNYDIIIHITTFLSLNDIISITNTSKIYYNIFNNDYFYNLSVNYYSYNFWKIASSRSSEFSKPLKNYKHELLRIEKFQESLEKYNSKRWTMHDFYSFWNYQEIYCKNN